ncbi:DUF723 domain-containing protein [Candidatus Dojkabacteria bacterium]|jgi:hypothetical protein|nr:DUF723 domain-containing protein [Candidatus Dojkabacteria bacterium]
MTKTESFVGRAKLVHGDRYDYSLVKYANAHTKVNIICHTHGIFSQAPAAHTSTKQGCPKCAGNTRQTIGEFTTRAKKVHGDKYDYSLVNYVNNNTKVTIICPEHGEFEQKPDYHTNSKAGCPMCADNIKLSTEEFIKRSKLIHNDKYNYSKVEYISTHKKVILICPIHGEFSQKPNNHISMKTGCPRCVSKTHSKMCIDWLESTMESEAIHIKHALNGGEFKIPTTNYSADGYCVDTNTIYEFYGDRWHGNPKIYEPDFGCYPKDKLITAGELYQKTVERENKIKSLGYNLITMWQSDWNDQQKLKC